MRYFVGILLIIVGFGIIWRTDWLISALGSSDWAEQKFGSGGTWTFYKLVGVVMIIFAFLLIFGRIFSILDFIFVR